MHPQPCDWWSSTILREHKRPPPPPPQIPIVPCRSPTDMADADTDTEIQQLPCLAFWPRILAGRTQTRGRDAGSSVQGSTTGRLERRHGHKGEAVSFRRKPHHCVGGRHPRARCRSTGAAQGSPVSLPLSGSRLLAVAESERRQLVRRRQLERRQLGRRQLGSRASSPPRQVDVLIPSTSTAAPCWQLGRRVAREQQENQTNMTCVPRW